MHKTILLKRLLLTLVILFAANNVSAQRYAVSGNLLEFATANVNAEISMVVSYNWSIHVPFAINPWTFGKEKKMKHLTFTPGARYWLKESFGHGWFVGTNAIISQYNMGSGGMFGANYRYEGMAYGLGFSAGYSLPVSTRWNFEFEFGVGGVYYNHDKFEKKTCGRKVGSDSGIFVVPNKLGVNFVYLF